MSDPDRVRPKVRVTRAQVPSVADLDPADCRRRVEQHFSAAAMTAGYVAVYDKLTQEAASRKQ